MSAEVKSETCSFACAIHVSVYVRFVICLAIGGSICNLRHGIGANHLVAGE